MSQNGINGTDRQAPAMRRALGRSGLGVGVRCCPPIAAVVCFARLCPVCLSLHWHRGCCTLGVSVRQLLVQTCYLYATSILGINSCISTTYPHYLLCPMINHQYAGFVYMQVLYVLVISQVIEVNVTSGSIESLAFHCYPGIFFCRLF